MKSQFQGDYRPQSETNDISKETTERRVDTLEARKASSAWTRESTLLNFTPQK